MRKFEGTKKVLSVLLCAVMVLGYLPTPAAAEEVTHQEGCAYVAPSEGTPCDHPNGCGSVDCNMSCTDTDGDGVINHLEGCTYREASDCAHQDCNCGYVAPSDGVDCDKDCANVQNPVDTVRAQVAALPAVEEAAVMSNEELGGWNNAIQAAYEAYKVLTDEQKAQLTAEVEKLMGLLNCLSDPNRVVPAANTGTTGNCTWTYDETTKTLTVSGQGAMGDETSNALPWGAYKNEMQKVVIQSGVTRIGKSNFYDFTSLAVIEIPNTVTSIGGWALRGCTSLVNITIPASVSYIDAYAFAACGNARKITYLGTTAPQYNQSNDPFLGCGTLTINVPEGYNGGTFCGKTVTKNTGAEVENYEVTVSAAPIEGGTVSGGGTYEEGKPVTVTATANSGYKFVCWMEGETSVSTSPSYLFAAASSRELTAKFAFYDITFDAQNGICDTTTATAGADGKLAALPIASRTGFTFKGWFDAATGGNQITADTVFTQDSTVYAQWDVIQEHTLQWSGYCTVVNEPTMNLWEHMPQDSVITAMTPTFGTGALNGLTPTWSSNMATIKFKTKILVDPQNDVLKVVVTTSNYGEITFIINIELKAPTYTVTVTTDGNGSASASPASGAAGTEVTLTAEPYEGYQFKEWQVVSGDVTVTDNKFTMGTANVEIKAIFEEAEAKWGTSADSLTESGTLAEAVAAKPAYIQLQKDVEYDGQLTVAGYSLTLDLKGKTLTSTYNINGGSTFKVDSGGTFELKNGTVTWRGTNAVRVRGANVLKNGKMIMTSSTITGFTHKGVHINAGGTLEMKNASSITNNSTDGSGAGVFVNGTLTMNGGSITGNSAQISGGGIHVEKYGTLNISGNVVINGNTCNGETDNVYLVTGKTIAVNTLAGGSNICVTLADGTGVFTSGGKDHKAMFTSDEGYTVLVKGENLELHDHVWQYQLKENTTDTITASCDCNEPGGTLTITATNGEYNGNAHTASLTQSTDWQGIAVSETGIVYAYKTSKDGNYSTVTETKNAGYYKASITLENADSEDATAYVEYTVSPKSLTAEGITASLSDNVVFGDDAPTLTVKDGDTTLTKDTDYTVTQTGKNGEFTLTVTGKGNYKDAYDSTQTYLVVTLPDPDEVEPDDKDAIDAYDRYSKLNETYKDDELAEKLEELYEALTDYKIIKGNKGRYVKGSYKKLSFTANGYYGKFEGVEVDGKLIDAKYYSAESGSTVITLKSSYLESLKSGKHTIQVNYTDGDTGGKDYFRITINNGSPFTGDNSHMMLFGGVAIISLLCMAMIVMFFPRKKDKYHR